MNNKSVQNELKKVSIIVPIYKSEPFLPRLIESMQNQTYSNLEIILVDDESPDNSGKICDEYAEKDTRIKVIHKKNGGCSEARNTGLKLVTGYYLTFIDGDDWMEPDCIEYFVNLMEKNDCQMAMSDNLMKESSPVQIEKDNIRILTNEQAVCTILYVDVPVAAWNKMYVTDIVKEQGLNFPFSYFGEGLYFSAMAAQYCERIALGHRKVYGYRMNNSNSGTTVRKVQDGINALDHANYVTDHLTLRTKAIGYAGDWHINRTTFNLFWYIYNSGEKKKHIDLLKKARKDLWRTFPSVFFHSKVSALKKIIIVLSTFFPRTASKMAEWRRKRLFEGKKMFC